MGLLGVLLGYIVRDAVKAGPGGPTKEEAQALEDSFDKRERDESFEQLAGKRCIECRSNIVAQREGQRCPTCNKALHKSCAAKHLTKCGAPKPPPYR